MLAVAVAAVEAVALRRQRADLQRLIDQRALVVAGQYETWSKPAAADFAGAINALHDFYVDDASGLRRPKGLALDDGGIDSTAISRWVLGYYAPARASGRSHEAAIAAMLEAAHQSEEFKAAHPGIR